MILRSWKSRAIGIFTLGGSFTGIVVIAIEVLGEPKNAIMLVIMLVFASLYAYGVVAGVLLLEQDPRSISKVFQFWLFQIPVVGSSWVTYEFSSGVGANFFVTDEVVIHFVPAYGSHFTFYLGSDQPFFLGLNLVAIAVVFWTWRLRREAA